MEEAESKHVIVLGAIRRGEKKFDKIQRSTKVPSEELNTILEELEEERIYQSRGEEGLARQEDRDSCHREGLKRTGSKATGGSRQMGTDAGHVPKR